MDDDPGLTEDEADILGQAIYQTISAFKRTGVGRQFHFALFVLTKSFDEDDDRVTTDMVASMDREHLEVMLRTWIGKKNN